MPTRRRKTWTDEEVTECLELVAAYGHAGFRRFAKRSGRDPEAVRIKIQSTERERWLEANATYHANRKGMEDVAVETMGTAEKVAAWWEGFAPIRIQPAPRRSTRQADAGVTVVASDFHFPLQDDAAVGVFLETVRQLKPATVILDGDLPDLLALSRYPKDVRHQWSLRDEAEAFQSFLHALEEVLPKDATLLELDANHSGDGTESRWWRYLSERVPELMQHPRAAEEMKYQRWWHPDWSRIQMAPEHIIAGELLVTHGTMARKWGGYTAKAHSETYLSSVMHGHTHRQGMHVRRVPAIGTRGEGIIRAYEIGCMCRLEPSYVKSPDWAQGFAVVTHDDTTFAAELVTIGDGVAAVGALGQTVRAA